MKKAAKKKAKGRPRKAAKMKVKQITITIDPQQDSDIKHVRKLLGLDVSKAVRWIMSHWKRG
jgi:cytochrome oxidase Cu insertion factor (SCO1/SenC/PrrC family)